MSEYYQGYFCFQSSLKQKHYFRAALFTREDVAFFTVFGYFCQVMPTV